MYLMMSEVRSKGSEHRKTKHQRNNSWDFFQAYLTNIVLSLLFSAVIHEYGNMISLFIRDFGTNRNLTAVTLAVDIATSVTTAVTVAAISQKRQVTSNRTSKTRTCCK